MSDTQVVAPKFRRIAGGLYGTGIDTASEHDATCDDYDCDHHRAEIVLDHYTDTVKGWTVRYVCGCGQMTASLGVWHSTLREAKQWVVDRGAHA